MAAMPGKKCVSPPVKKAVPAKVVKKASPAKKAAPKKSGY